METTLVILLFSTFIFFLVIGAPISLSLGLATLAGYFFLEENPIKLVQVAFNSVGSFPLMALPAFVLAGSLMEAAGISRRLVNIAESIAGPFTGGLGMATVLGCVFFGAISGSGPATTAAVGMLMIPAMTKHAYDKSYACALTASAGGIGIIVPPSIPMVIYGVSGMGIKPLPEDIVRFGEFQSLSIPKLFIAGFFPAFLIALCLLLANFYLSKKKAITPLAKVGLFRI